MEHNLPQTIALLTSTPATLNALLRDLPDAWTMQNEGKDTWNSFEIIGHLIDCERVNWMPRAKFLLQHGESRKFESFDRGGHIRETQNKSLNQLLDEFARLRSENLRELSTLNLQPEDLERQGQHPAFGTVTLSQLLATWAIHDLTHLHQISRTLAHQYRDTVGPWSAYLGVLQCSGHSAP
ncbi:MAG: DinB family protein [Edaphobacter sp.]